MYFSTDTYWLYTVAHRFLGESKPWKKKKMRKGIAALAFLPKGPEHQLKLYRLPDHNTSVWKLHPFW